MQIGRRLPESIVANPVPVPETQLEPFLERDGFHLRVVLSSRQFEILDAEQELVLPPAGPSKMIHFRLRTPPADDSLQLRAAIYYQNNLLQSIRVTADAEGNRAEVEYCLCGTMHDVDMYPPRSVNFLLNESRDGTHTFAVAGTDIRENFTFTEGEMRNALRETRRTLLEICARLDVNGNPIGYRFASETNRGTRAQFEKDIRKLAYAGRDLYAVFVTNKNQTFAKKLRASLIPKFHIQVAAMRSAKYVFPWSLVYDKLLLEEESNVVCPEFLADVEGSRGFRCLSSSGCPNVNDSNVICPSGFWGYRHVIEQPPSIAQEETTAARDLPLRLDVTGDPKLMMAVSLELAHADKHYKELKRVRPYQIDLTRDKKATVDAMLGQPAPNLVYFYCHGGTKRQGLPRNRERSAAAHGRSGWLRSRMARYASADIHKRVPHGGIVP